MSEHFKRTEHSEIPLKDISKWTEHSERTEDSEIQLKEHIIKFVPKKKNKLSIKKTYFRDQDGFRLRAYVEVGRHITAGRFGHYYNYGRIQLDVDTNLIGRYALVQVYIPNHPIDESVEDTNLYNFLYQDGNEWTKLLESEEDRNARIKKDVVAKIKEQKKLRK